MWIVDETLRSAEWADESEVLFHITGMNPSRGLTQMLMADCKADTLEKRKEAAHASFELMRLIQENAKKE